MIFLVWSEIPNRQNLLKSGKVTEGHGRLSIRKTMGGKPVTSGGPACFPTSRHLGRNFMLRFGSQFSVFTVPASVQRTSPIAGVPSLMGVPRNSIL